MTEKEYFHIQLDPCEIIYSNFKDLAGDNFYVRKNQSLLTFFDFDTRSIFWLSEIDQIESKFQNFDFKNTELVTGMEENFLFTFLYVFGVQNESFSMN